MNSRGSGSAEAFVRSDEAGAPLGRGDRAPHFIEAGSAVRRHWSLCSGFWGLADQEEMHASVFRFVGRKSVCIIAAPPDPPKRTICALRA